MAQGRQLAVLVAVVAGLCAPAASADGGLTLTDTKQLDPRLQELTFTTPALPAPTHVRVLLPDGYDASGATRYPVLYLLHGGNGSYADWTKPGTGDAENATAGLPLIVVMPDAGLGGWYTDWFNPGAKGQPQWETYHVGQLIPWVDAHLPTIAGRDGRAIAGLSMGGFGALSYAARHPDVFVAASAWSGAVNTNDPPAVAAHVIDLIAGLDGALPGSLFGLRETQEIRWRGHNPWDLASNLRRMTLALHTGNGDSGGTYGGGPFDPLETAVHPMNVDLHQRLEGLHIAHLWDDYGPGAHAWPYWNRDLREDLPRMMATFADPPAKPRRVRYRSIEPSYDIYGWHVDVERDVTEFSVLRKARRQGFVLRGSGDATVTTPARYTPGRAFDVTVGKAEQTLTADDAGRLRIAVPLGPSNLVQQNAVPEANLPQPAVTARVKIQRAGA